MKSRLATIISETILVGGTVTALAFFAPALSAQGRGGMRGAPGGGSHAHVIVRGGEGGRFGRTLGRGYGYYNGGYWYPPYLFPEDDYYDESYGPPPQQVIPNPAEVVTAPAAQPAAPPPAPVEPLLLEVRDGQWVRVPTGSQLPLPQAAGTDAVQTASAHPGITEPAVQAPPAPPLPPAAIVFRDGHTEEIAKYMIQGDYLYTSTDYWTTGKWSRKIPLADLDIPASLKLNRDRGTKFNLPSNPNEVMIRF